jgi:hypothetical protein
MRDKTREYIRRICQINANTTDEECVALLKELDQYLVTLPKDERNEFAQSGYGEMLRMCCPDEAVALPPEAYLN